MLRTRIILNLVPFVAILLGVGVYAIVLFSRLADSLDNRFRSNYDGMVAAQNMSLELSRLDRGVLLGLRGDASGQSLYQDNAKVFEAELQRQLQRTNLVHEAEYNRQLVQHYDAFRHGVDRMFPLQQGVRQSRLYEQESYPNLLSLYVVLEKIRQLNEQAILQSNTSAAHLTRHVTGLMLSGLLIALVVFGYACYHLARSILQPIQHLTAATQAAGEGDLDHLVPVISKDELGMLAESFNKMAAQLRAYRLSTTERILRLHRTMETTLASFPDPIYVLSKDCRIEFANPAAQGLSKALHLNGQLPEPLPTAARRVLESGEHYLPNNYKEALSFGRGGDDRHFLPRILAMRNTDDSLMGVAVVLYDMTRFRQLDFVKTGFAANASHELKTPLTSMRMALHLLTEKANANLTPRQQELLFTAREDTERLLGTLNDLLDLARLEEGQTELQMESLAVGDLMRDAINSLGGLLAAKGLQVRCKVPPDLPPLRVDRHLICLALGNLLSNAVKHSPRGEEICLSAAYSTTGGVQLSVIDHGPGVPREFQDRIFDRFFRVPGQTKSGAGLGLSIAKEIVVAHDGRIGVKNRPGQGSEFYIVLPAGELAKAEKPIAERAVQLVAPA